MWVIGKDDPTYRKQVRVSSVDDLNNKFTIAFNGAPSGNYKLEVIGPYGNLDTTGINLKTEGFITSFTPIAGSVNGGTLITIIGDNFSPNNTDNIVVVGNEHCVTESSSD